LVSKGRQAEAQNVRRALNDYSERYVHEVFESMTGPPMPRRIYGEAALQAAYGSTKTADMAIDYGDCWLVAEVTTRQATRDTVNAASVDGLVRDRDAIIAKSEQIAATIENIRGDEQPLTGHRRSHTVTFYPLIVLTEGFPSNPVMSSLIRDELRRRAIFAGAGIAALEVVDIVELDMIEGVVERGGPPLPEILRMKAASHFHADSVRNFLVSDMRLVPRRPERVGQAFRRFFSRLVAELDGDRRLFD
jgi:hypothetical protein